MRKIFVILFLSFVLIAPHYINGQSKETRNADQTGYFLIDDAFYIYEDNEIALDDWVEHGLHVLFATSDDTLTISIDIGGRDNVYFLGIATAIDNPGFIVSGLQAEFYHWIFVSHIKEGVNNAYIHKEYVEESLEKLGRMLYFINILFSDQTEFQFYGYEVNSESR